LRLVDRRAEVSEIEAPYTGWNAQLDESGRAISDVAR
jgi:hypothetical protein